VAVLARGKHRRRRFHRPAPAARRDEAGFILAEAADRDMTLPELRAFLVRAETAAVTAGADLEALRWRVAVRHSGFARAIWVKVP
jgi:hypothetical protein